MSTTHTVGKTPHARGRPHASGVESFSFVLRVPVFAG